MGDEDDDEVTRRLPHYFFIYSLVVITLILFAGFATLKWAMLPLVTVLAGRETVLKVDIAFAVSFVLNIALGITATVTGVTARRARRQRRSSSGERTRLRELEGRVDRMEQGAGPGTGAPAQQDPAPTPNANG